VQQESPLVTDNPHATKKLEFLIDLGAIYSVVPQPVLEKLGIRPVSEQEFRLPDGTKIVRKKGIALFKYGDRRQYFISCNLPFCSCKLQFRMHSQ
jgi:predicted aspartyl protease